jgi:predicted dehydrogenase
MIPTPLHPRAGNALPDDATSPTDARQPARRRFLRGAAGSLAPLIALPAFAQGAGSSERIELPPVAAETEPPESIPEPADPPSRRIGFALVGLGHLTLSRLMPAFGESKHCKPVALVSGDRDKARKLARQHDIPESSIYDYANFDRIADNPAIDVVYIVLPNSMHAEFTIRAAKAGKHVLCEKPMAVSARECQQMIEACAAADRKLMIAYRSQYEPMNRAIVKMVRDNKLGTLKEFISTNSQNMGDPNQWRLKKALAGGGALPDVGVYCLNTARFLSGEEPSEVLAWTHSTAGDVRFREVEETMHFVLRFPSGLQATCHTSYGANKSQMLRLMGTEGWVELNPAYAYEGIRLRHSHVVGGQTVIEEPAIGQKNQFALEMDHMASCVRTNSVPHSPGEEGLQDQRIVEALYESARGNGKPVALAMPKGLWRGPDPASPA